jgi:hypothetical protein
MFSFPRRPGLVRNLRTWRRDPYSVSYRFGEGAETFCNNEHPWLRVLAFAGTTGDSYR